MLDASSTNPKIRGTRRLCRNEVREVAFASLRCRELSEANAAISISFGVEGSLVEVGRWSLGFGTRKQRWAIETPAVPF